MGRIFGASPRPRVLIQDIPEDFHQGYRDRFPTVVAVQNLSDVDQAEFDMLVTTWSALRAEEHLCAIVFSGPRVAFSSIDETASGNVHFSIAWKGESKAREFHVPTDLPEEVRRFVQERLIPVVRSKPANPILSEMSLGLTAPIITPFLQSARGEVLAGRFRRLSGVECWAFPKEMVDFGAECSAIAVGLWRLQDSSRFPETTPDWTQQSRWQTAEEEERAKELIAVRERRAKMLASLQAEEETLEVRLRDVRSRVDVNERLLLTAQGDELVRMVARCLEEFGFETQYMDDLWKPGDRREDLRIRLGIDPDWITIAEVRGFAKGAEQNDLLRIGRFRTRYVRDERILPSGSWYIANEFINQDPAGRPRILQSNDKEVETFGEDDGLAIGTVTLFDMLMDLRGGRLTHDEAQRLLRDGRGRLTYQRRGAS